MHLGKVAGEVKWHIAHGFKAWCKLRNDGLGQYPPRDQSSAEPRGEAAENVRRAKDLGLVITEDKVVSCPFAAQHITKSAARNPSELSSGADGLKFRDGARLDNKKNEDPIVAETRPVEAQSTGSLYHAASQEASTSKCPIRFLDQHSPEEVAEYFQNHRHEIPRSHEICVKRFQRSEDQIRQLDHKYGNLVNMIQGLGQKHQPMLHTRTDGKNGSEERTSQEKVEAWAHEVNDGQKARSNDVGEVAEEGTGSQRVGRFDRPLKEIRVGESPSRPWGISVPQAAPIAPSAISAQKRPDLDVSHHSELPRPSTASLEQRRTKSPINLGEPIDRRPKMIFTGPVFMGYSPDQITDILQHTSLGKSNSQ